MTDVFVGPTSRKEVRTVAEAAEQAKDVRADTIVGVGGGASLVVARQAAALVADGRSVTQLQEEAARTSRLVLGTGRTPPVVVLLPTTLAGGDLSVGGSFTVLSAAESASGRPLVVNPATVGPDAVVYDPELFAATPDSVLASSAFNGLNKAVETVYGPSASHWSDAVAGRAVTLMTAGLLRLAEERLPALELAVSGVVLAQLKREISVLHAAGQAVSRHFGVQQGVAHAALTPPILAVLLGRADLRRAMLAACFREASATTSPDDAEAVVDAVATLRARLGLAATLAPPASGPVDLRQCAEDWCADPLMWHAPAGVRLHPDDVLPLLEELMEP
jgi:alcohol dehydrogenase class IV